MCYSVCCMFATTGCFLLLPPTQPNPSPQTPHPRYYQARAYPYRLWFSEYWNIHIFLTPSYELSAILNSRKSILCRERKSLLAKWSLPLVRQGGHTHSPTLLLPAEALTPPGPKVSIPFLLFHKEVSQQNNDCIVFSLLWPTSVGKMSSSSWVTPMMREHPKQWICNYCAISMTRIPSTNNQQKKTMTISFKLSSDPGDPEADECGLPLLCLFLGMLILIIAMVIYKAIKGVKE